MADLPSYIDPRSRVAVAWNKQFSDVACVPSFTFSSEDSERHSIYSLLLMAMVKEWWNGNKNGSRGGTYPWREKQQRSDGSYLGDRLGDRYIGHNIGAIAVDAEGRIVDFDFNHNKLFNSSVQHAEARLVRRVFGLAAVQDSWDLASGPRKYRTDLTQTTVYTSLESCAQCAGIMALAQMRNVFYLQPDPGQYFIAQIIKNLSDADVPNHLPATSFGLKYFKKLADAYAVFQTVTEEKPFFLPENIEPRPDKAITSFLCTDIALEIYTEAANEFASFVCEFSNYAPTNEKTHKIAMTNSEVLTHARQFLDYVVKAAKRGTPHFN